LTFTSDSPALPQRLKAATRTWHARAERSGVMGALLQRRLGRPGYVALLRNLQAIYEALESALDRLQPALAALGAGMPAVLRRGPALAADVDWLDGAGADSPPVAAASEYARRLEALNAGDAHLLLAHTYVRYLGDLHGGQVLRPLVRGLYGLASDADDGTRFYDFGDDATVAALRIELRHRLGAARLSAAQADAVVTEAVWAFEAHCRLFEQLQAAEHPPADRP
jgi:heme oxygenase (biliverdin-producing, ferredoxin)